MQVVLSRRWRGKPVGAKRERSFPRGAVVDMGEAEATRLIHLGLARLDEAPRVPAEDAGDNDSEASEKDSSGDDGRKPREER